MAKETMVCIFDLDALKTYTVKVNTTNATQNGN